MPKFISRKGGGDLPTNPYYNEWNWVTDLGYGTPNYQCTQWAWQRTQEIAEERTTYITSRGEKRDLCRLPMFSRSGYGNACEWFKDSIWEKTRNPDEIRLGDIVVYDTTYGGGFGHVRIVEKLDDKYMYLSGGNEDYKGNVSFNIKQERDAPHILGFIHNPFITESEDYKALYLDAQSKLERIKAILNE